ncbi:MAG TPA: DUF6089 family protein [Chitinophagales bacterium]|nr:hypothetical protein [Chitinophagales bacterium]HQU75242.1 DUF6089 family protein [Chitinophagales bacterium]
MAVILLATGVCSGQTKYRDAEVGINLGFSNFLGDLGGSRMEGRALWWDIDPEVTRPAIGVIYRQEVVPHISVRLNAYYTQIRGADSLSENDFRSYRNLSFKSPLTEVCLYVDYTLRRLTGPNRERFTPFVYAGAGMCWFNPQALYEGQWVELQPLGTEGQGLPQYPDRQPYAKYTFVFPFGGGIKYLTRSNWVFGMETASRLSLSDYMDDVSNSYPNPDYFFGFYDPATATMVAALSDMSDHTRPDLISLETGRGNPKNRDAYVLGGLFTITYHFDQVIRPKPGSCFFKEKR